MESAFAALNTSMEKSSFTFSLETAFTLLFISFIVGLGIAIFLAFVGRIPFSYKIFAQNSQDSDDDLPLSTSEPLEKNADIEIF